MVKFFPQAEARLIEIWDYTLEKWDEAQADEYVSELVAEIGMTARWRSRWRPVTERALRGVWFFRHRHYFVFFRELSEGRHRGHRGAAREHGYTVEAEGRCGTDQQPR